MTLFQYFCCILFVLIQVSDQAAIENRIVNGKKVSIKQYPYQAALFHRTQNEIFFMCGGSIISKKYILTAAHCVTRPRLGFIARAYALARQDILVMVGKSSNNYSEDSSFQVRKITVHPKFDWIKFLNVSNGEINPFADGNSGNDIALIKLKKSLKWSPKIRKIRLPKSGPQYSFWGKTAVATGYGRIYNNEATTDLYALSMTLPKPDANISNLLGEGLICVVPVENRSLCMGDSGGPLVIGKVQYGVANSIAFAADGLHQKCQQSTYNIFADVTFYREWISENSDVDKEDDSSECSCNNCSCSL